MSEIAWNLLQPVDTGALTQQGFATGAAMVKQVQTRNALRTYLANPDDQQAYNALAAFSPEAAASIQRQQMLRRKEAVDQQDRGRAVALGQLYTKDPKGAREEAVAAGDFDLAKQFGEMDKAKQEESAGFWDKAGSVAFQLRKLPTPEARAEYWKQARPILEAQGAPTDMLDKFDPNNPAQVDAAIATASKVSELWTQSKPQEFNVGPGEGRYERDPLTGELRTIIAPNPGGQPFGAPATGVPAAAPAASVGAVKNTLVGGGMPAHVAAGFLGNFDVEGGYGGGQGDGGASGGIGQWNGPRRDNFKRIIGKDPTAASPEEGAKFVLWEMRNPAEAGMTVAQRDAILNAKSAPEAAELIDKYYERSSGEHRQKRIAAASRHAAAVHHNEADIRAAANRAIANGADPQKVRERAAAQGVAL